uniref:Uncharacterized protein n=1 Tax=Romanomermis culicivorax TaxID=13658 RepID=A0A915I3A7_ROMCU
HAEFLKIFKLTYSKEKNFPKKIGKDAPNCQQAPMLEWLHREHHVGFSKPQEQQDNCFFFIDGYAQKSLEDQFVAPNIMAEEQLWANHDQFAKRAMLPEEVRWSSSRLEESQSDKRVSIPRI